MLLYQPYFLSVSSPSAAADAFCSRAREPTIYFVLVVLLIPIVFARAIEIVEAKHRISSIEVNSFSPRVARSALFPRAPGAPAPIVCAGVLNTAASFVAGAIITPSNLGSQNLDGWQIRQRDNIGRFPSAGSSNSQNDLRLVEFGAEFLDDFGRRRNVSLAGDHGQLAGQRRSKVRHARFFDREAENGILDNVHLRARLVQAFAQLGDRADFKPAVIHHDKIGRGVEPCQILVANIFFSTRMVMSRLLRLGGLQEFAHIHPHRRAHGRRNACNCE